MSDWTVILAGRIRGVLAVLALTAATIVALAAPVFAQQPNVATSNRSAPVALPQGNTHLQPFDALSFLISENTQLDPEAVLARRGEFQPVKSPWVDFGDHEGAIWLLVSVENTAARGGEWMVDIQRPFADDLIVTKIAQDGSQETLLAFDRSMPFNARPVVSQYLVAPLWMEAGEQAQILVGLTSSTGSWLPLTFTTPERMRTAHMQEARFNWIINGAMAALVVVALAMGRLVGWPLVLAFASYASLSALFVANNEGYLHRFIWPDNMGAYELANLLFLIGMMLALLQFARLFANLKENFPKANTAALALSVLLCFLGLASAFFWQLDMMRWLVFLTVPFVALSYFSIAVMAWRAKVLGAVPFIAGSLAIIFTVVTITAVLLSPGQLPLTIALDYFHITVLFESLAFLVAILVRMLAIQSELSRSLAAEIATTREKLALSEALQSSNQRYDKARDLADTLRARLASTSHDLQQPLVSLRQSLERLSQHDPEASLATQAALDYLHKVTASGLDNLKDDPLAGEKPQDGSETFPVGLVFSNCANMFQAEAQSAGIELRIRPSRLKITTDPIDLMRALSNLISNAVKHSEGDRILVAAQKRRNTVLIRVIDNGKGMDEDEIEHALQAYTKGQKSDGHGLGLHLVWEYAEKSGHGAATRSKPDRGFCVTLSIPKG
ncbi:MAG: sensor histidine kinase [Pseudomonadota bacterium]